MRKLAEEIMGILKDAPVPMTTENIGWQIRRGRPGGHDVQDDTIQACLDTMVKDDHITFEQHGPLKFYKPL